MKSAFALLLLVSFPESWSLTPQATPSQPEKESSWPKKPLHSNLMIENPNLFSPRMDYDEWTPLGRGDPLKNDPTYDYVPPVLERVHYWMDPSKRTPDPPLPNSGVLVLGSRTESTFTTRPTTPRYQSFQSKESQADSRIDTSSLLDPFFKLMDVSQFNLNFNSNANYKPVLNRIHRPHYQNNKQRTQPPQALQRPPYTMLMPPPPPPPSALQSTNYITTVPDKTQTTVPIPPTSNPPLTSKNVTTINPTVLANTENVFKPVAISMPEHAELFENETQNEITVKPFRKLTTEATTYLGEQTSTRPPKHTEKQGQQATTPFVKHTPREPTKIPFRPSEIETTHYVKKLTKVPPWYRETENRATITPPVTTTKINTLTTDPMFKHYKQPSEPIKGPFYLIIQGHSKVKTYGASKNPVNKLLTSNEIKFDDEEIKKNKFERKTRRLTYETANQEEQNKLDENHDEVRSFPLTIADNLKSLEETFGKSNGGSSKKRYLGSNHRRKRFIYDGITNKSRRLLNEKAEPDCSTPEGRNATISADNLDLESLIAISDDYDPEDVASILLKDEGGQGSGFGGLALSILTRSDKKGYQEV